MSIKNRVQLTSDGNSRFPDNNNKEINAERLRNHVKDLVDSAVLKVGDTGIQNVLRYLNSVVISDDYDLTTKKFVVDLIAVIDLSTFFEQGGNAFGATAVLGTTDNQDLNFITNNVARGAVLKTGEFVFGAVAKFTNTFLSVKSAGATIATYAQQWQNSGSTLLGWMRDDGLLNAVGGLSTDGTKSISVDTSRLITYLLNQSTGTGNHKFLGGSNAGASANGNYLVALLTGAGSGASGDLLTCIGLNAGANYAGNSSILMGDGAGELGAGDENLIFGPSGAGYSIIGSKNNGVGRSALYQLVGSNVTGFGESIFRGTTISNAFGVAQINSVWLNGHGASGFATLQAVTVQTAMAPDGTNESAAASILKLAPARGTGNAASGNLVLQYANIQASGTTRHTLSDGLVFGGNTGYITSTSSTGETRKLADEWITFSTDTTVTNGIDFEYTGAGGHTLTIYSASLWKGTELTIMNEGSGNLTVDTLAGTFVIAAGDAQKLKSNGTNWI